MAVIYTPHYAQFFDTNGLPLNGGKLYTYAAGTTTPKATYTTAAGTVANANPVILDSSGRATIFLNGSYKFTLKTSADVLVEETDNITAFSTQSSTVDNIIANFTEDVVVAGDSIIFSDVSDGGTTKRDTVQGVLDLVAATSTSFSPTIRGTTTAGTGTYTLQSGSYVRLNKLVFFELQVSWTNLTGAAGTLAIGNLPITNGSLYSPVTIITNGVTSIAGSIIRGWVFPSNNYIELYDQSTGGALSGTALDTTGTITISGMYLT